MLYVFLVNTGRMMTFDMNHAVESVNHLKAEIAHRCDVPAEKQVLLISGGESLQPSASVGSYNGGTDTNPIFLFNKCSIESDCLPPLHSDDSMSLSGDVDMHEKVEAVMNLPPSLNTVVTRTQLAQTFQEQARHEIKACEMLVHDQHLQQQGWYAVVANLEDTTVAFRNSAAVFEQSFLDFLQGHSQHTALLESFNKDLELLAKIPVLPALLTPDQQPDASTVMLLDWINSKDSQNSLEQVVQQCSRLLKQLNEKTLETLKATVQATLAEVDNQNMKEIRGLGERLFGLEELMRKAHNLVQDQHELAQAFLQNQSRAQALRDMSIFPDLCSSHARQLKIMLGNHQQLRDMRRRCAAAKEELSLNLKSRLRWIIYVEKAISDVSMSLLFYSETAKRVRRHMEVCRQVHLAPGVYLRAVAEVVRRRSFSLHFLEWAGSLSSQCQQLHQDEVQTRKDFNSHFSKHFLHALFPGMDDLPPPFATRNPKPFDDHLPPLAPDDLELLRSALPELSDLLVATELRAMPTVLMAQSVGTSSDAPPQLKPESSSDTGSCQHPLPVSEIKALPENIQAVASEEDCSDGKTAADHEHTPKLDETDDEFEEVADLPSTAVLPDEGSAEVTQQPNQDVTVQSPDSLGHMSQDFLTADFYIDESMPSSYSDSNGVAVLASSGQPLVPSQSDALTSELQRQLDEKSASLLVMQKNLDQERAELCEFRRSLSCLHKAAAAIRDSCHSDAASLRQDLSAARLMLAEHASQVNSAVEDALQALLARAERDQVGAVAVEVERLQRKQQAAEEELRQALDVEKLKLEDAHREVHLYQQQLQQLSQLVDSLRHDSNLALASLRDTLQEERKSELTKLTLEHELEQQSLIDQLASFRKMHEEQVQDLNECICEKDRQIHMLFQEHQGIESRLTARFSLEKEELLAQCQQEFRQREQNLREELAAKHREELDRLQHCQEEAVQKAKEEAKLEFQQEWEARANSLKRQVSLEDVTDAVSGGSGMDVTDLGTQRQNYENQIALLKATMEAEHCRLVEEAVNEAVRERDEELSDLRNHCEQLRRLLEEKGSGQFAQTSTQGDEEKDLSAEVISGQMQDISCPMVDSKLDLSSTSMMESTMKISQAPDPVLDLRNQLQYKDQEVTRLQQKIMAMSDVGTQLAPAPQDKVSILTCSVGDVVLLCYDEGHQNYVLFVLGPVLHFLHTDCLETLGLQTAPGSTRKGWVLAEVLDKEFCQARKSQNRYRVPTGTRFYRVKVKPWDKEAAVQRMNKRRHSLRSLGLTSVSSSGPLTTAIREPSVASGDNSSGEPFAAQGSPIQLAH